MTRRLSIVCSGNTCRSPMAAALASRWPGVEVTASGLDVVPASVTSKHAITVLAELGLETPEAEARRFDPSAAGDAIWVMEARHRAVVIARHPELADLVELLDPDGGDIPDPFGEDLATYRAVRDRIRAALEARLGPPP